jgi:hypothetical protein
MFEDLDKFSSIGWDFDETMIDHPNSGKIQEYIKDNPKKKHYILTFRTHNLVNQIFPDLAKYPFDLDKTNFVNVFHIEDEAWAENNQMDYLRIARIKFGPLTPPEIYYKTWKGMICAKHNIPVLVDDREKDVILGCEKYNIIYIHPNDLYM